MKMIPEIELLVDNFSNLTWDMEVQVDYMSLLVQQDFYQGNLHPKDLAFSARDRINRAPKALGFVDISPLIKITDAGRDFISGQRVESALLRQLLKFQLPSPFHVLPNDSEPIFWVKPYLEILRLVNHFGTISFDEILLFGMQLTDYRKFDVITEEVEKFRKNKASAAGNYRNFFGAYCQSEIAQIYADELSAGKANLRESGDVSHREYIATKRNNMRDYTDACFRYLRATGLVSLSQSGHSLSVPPDKKDEVSYILSNVSPEPQFIDTVDEYKAYLFGNDNPALFTDDVRFLKTRILSLDSSQSLDGKPLHELQEIEDMLREQQQTERIAEQIASIKSYREYHDIQDVFSRIEKKEYFDNPLMLEWNTWRAMTMLDGGDIMGNFTVDDEGQPLSTATGNAADIYCDYGDFDVIVEVTLQSGQRQYNSEAEPVARHLGRSKEATGKDTYCLFVAPNINEATVAHFYVLHSVRTRLYGGNAIILPLPLAIFRKMMSDSCHADFVPGSERIRTLCEKSVSIAKGAKDETDWFEGIQRAALSWLESD
jgi:hypothetical protein